MQLTKQQFWSLIIAVLMIGSTAGIIGFSGSSPSGNGTAPTPELPAGETPTTVTYDAGGISSKVLEVFPTVVVIASSNDFSVDEAASKLLALGDVITVNSAQFLSNEASSENFRAELRLISQDKVRTLGEKIGAIDTFSSVQVFPQALVSLPEKVSFRNEGLDLDLEHSFGRPQTQAFISSSTQKGDDILLSIQANFQGQALLGMLSFEEQNLTSSPQLYFADQSFQISILANEFFVRSTSPLSMRAALDAVQSDLEAPDSEAVVQVVPASNTMTVVFADTSSIEEQGLSTFLSGFEGVESFDLQLDSNRADVTFSGGADFVSFRDSLREGLTLNGIGVAEIQEPIVSLQGNLSNEDKASLLAAVSASSERNGVEIEVLQKAVFEAASITIPDENASFALNEGSFEAFVQPTHSVGDSIPLSLIIFASPRDGITDIQAQEAVQQTEIT